MFHVACRVTHPSESERAVNVPFMVVDTKGTSTWIAASQLDSIGIPREPVHRTFEMADGRVIVREIGYAVLHVGAEFTIDEVVFAEPGDLQVLGARTLSGLGLRIDPVRKMLVPAGPAPAACAAA